MFGHCKHTSDLINDRVQLVCRRRTWSCTDLHVAACSGSRCCRQRFIRTFSPFACSNQYLSAVKASGFPFFGSRFKSYCSLWGSHQPQSSMSVLPSLSSVTNNFPMPCESFAHVSYVRPCAFKSALRCLLQPSTIVHRSIQNRSIILTHIRLQIDRMLRHFSSRIVLSPECVIHTFSAFTSPVTMSPFLHRSSYSPP